MVTAEVRRIRSGVEDDFAWVSLWFQGDGRKLEPFHISCKKEVSEGRLSKFDTIYIERGDQMMACYGGAKEIVVGVNGIKIHLKRAEAKKLGLITLFGLTVPKRLSGWSKGLQVFQEMATYPTGRVIKIHE